MIARLVGWWRRNFLRAEFALSLAVALAVAVWIYALGGEDDLDCLLGSNRPTIYATLAGIFGALLGFVITTLSIVVALASIDRLAVVRESTHYDTLWRTFKAGIRSQGLATAAAVTALVADRATDPVRPVVVTVVFTTALATLRLGRCVWILEQVLGIAVRPVRVRAPGE